MNSRKRLKKKYLLIILIVVYFIFKVYCIVTQNATDEQLTETFKDAIVAVFKISP